MTLPIGQSLGRYRILEQLGEGGMAVVYKAYDTVLERDVAIKIIRTQAFAPDQLDGIVKRFEREAKALAKLSHPNIVGVLDYGYYEGSPFFVMEYLPGGTLKHRGKPMPWREAVQILLPILEALQYAHEHKIIHRDIKPSNILLTDQGQPTLTDFGIAKILETVDTVSLTSSGMTIGTPEYMAPEQWTGETSPRSDIYSIGVVLYEMVTGRKPYVADTPAAILLKQSNDPLPLPTQYVHDLPEGIEKIVLKALAKNPEDRYPDVAAMIRAIEELRRPVSSAASTVLIDQPARGNAAETITASDVGKQATPVARVPASERKPPLLLRYWYVALGVPICILVIIGLAAAGYVMSNRLLAAPTATLVPIVPAGPTDTSEPDTTASAQAEVELTQAALALTQTALVPITTTPPITDTIPPSSQTLSYTSTASAYCWDYPGATDTNLDSHYDFSTGRTFPVLGKADDSNSYTWILLAVKPEAQYDTRTQCCWVDPATGTLSVDVSQIATVTNWDPSMRFDCSTINTSP